MIANMFTSIILTVSIMFVAGIISGWIVHRDKQMNLEE